MVVPSAGAMAVPNTPGVQERAVDRSLLRQPMVHCTAIATLDLAVPAALIRVVHLDTVSRSQLSA